MGWTTSGLTFEQFVKTNDFQPGVELELDNRRWGRPEYVLVGTIACIGTVGAGVVAGRGRIGDTEGRPGAWAVNRNTVVLRFRNLYPTYRYDGVVAKVT